MELLAQIEHADPVTVRDWLLIATFFLGGLAMVVNTGLALIRHFRGEPPASERYATKADFRELDQELKQLDQKLDQRFDRGTQRQAESREKIYERINALERGQAELTAECRSLLQQFLSTAAKIDALFERLTKEKAG